MKVTAKKPSAKESCAKKSSVKKASTKTAARKTFVEDRNLDGSENRVQVMRFGCTPTRSLSRQDRLGQ